MSQNYTVKQYASNVLCVMIFDDTLCQIIHFFG